MMRQIKEGEVCQRRDRSVKVRYVREKKVYHGWRVMSVKMR